MAQQTDRQMPKIVPLKTYSTSIIASKKKPLSTQKTATTTTTTANKGAVVIHSQNSYAQRKALEARLERLENSDMTPEKKAVIREKIQTRLKNLK